MSEWLLKYVWMMSNSHRSKKCNKQPRFPLSTSSPATNLLTARMEMCYCDASDKLSFYSSLFACHEASQQSCSPRNAQFGCPSQTSSSQTLSFFYDSTGVIIHYTRQFVSFCLHPRSKTIPLCYDMTVQSVVLSNKCEMNTPINIDT